MAFLDRHSFIQFLYDHIQDKSKVLTRKRVARVETGEVDARVVTTDGSVYVGDIVVGADGIHSTVRREMDRLAAPTGVEFTVSKETFQKTLDPSITGDAADLKRLSTVSADYWCIFGISSQVPGLTGNKDFHFVSDDKFSYLVANGPSYRVYWFIAIKFDRTLFGAEIPRFSHKQVDAVLEKHLNDPITQTVRFRDVYKRKLITVMAPLEEVVHERWHFGRIIALGDASNKVLDEALYSGM
jgi:2-polyprenyl-6-methoxyphenol hydroxylase-like FAD-dependent oxidoreductase